MGHCTLMSIERNTNTCHFLKADSQCSQKYKNSVITSYINVAYKVSENWNAFHSEVKTIKQILVNNNLTNTNIDKVINKFLFKIHTADDNDTKSYINIYYQNQFQNNYKIDEKTIKNIVKNYVKCIDKSKKVQLIILYNNQKTSSLIMRNINNPRLVYKFESFFTW